MQHDALIERRHSWNAGLRERLRRLESRWHRTHPLTAMLDALGDSQSADAGEWTRFGISEVEQRVLEHQRPNVLIIGAGPSVERIVSLLERTCIPPVVRCTACPLVLPTGEVGTLTISNAERLDTLDQQLLFAWLSCTTPRRQVITTAAVPLFPAVVGSTFSEALFYRLNALCLMMDDKPTR
jgi:hypothetical protein